MPDIERPDMFRQVMGEQGRPFSGFRTYPVQGVEQFPDIAWPVIDLKVFQEGLRHDPSVSGIDSMPLFQVGLGKQDHVISPVFQRGQMDGQRNDPEKQVFPEFTLFHHSFEVPVGGTDEPEITVELGFRSQGTEFLFLDRPEKFFLDRQGQLSYFVQEQGSLVGDLHEPGPVPVRPGERPPGMAENRTFHQVLGQRRAVHHHKGIVTAGAAGMNGPGKKLFTGAGFTGDQHWNITLGRHAHFFKTFVNGRTFSHNSFPADGVPGKPGFFLAAVCHRPFQGKPEILG